MRKQVVNGRKVGEPHCDPGVDGADDEVVPLEEGIDCRSEFAALDQCGEQRLAGDCGARVGIGQQRGIECRAAVSHAIGELAAAGRPQGGVDRVAPGNSGWILRLHLRAELSKDLHSPDDCILDVRLGSDVQAQSGTICDADAARCRLAFEAQFVIARLEGQCIPVPAVRPADHGKDAGGIRNATGHRPNMTHQPERSPRRMGNAPEARLEAEGACEGGRNPDRSAAIGTDRGRRHAQRDRRRSTAAAAAGRAVPVPGVPGNARERTVGDDLVGEIWQCSLAETDGAGLAQPGDARTVRRGW